VDVITRGNLLAWPVVLPWRFAQMSKSQGLFQDTRASTVVFQKVVVGARKGMLCWGKAMFHFPCPIYQASISLLFSTATTGVQLKRMN